MRKEDVELINLSITISNFCLLRLKIYKDGTLHREGSGGFPPIGLKATTHKGDPSVFNHLIGFIEKSTIENTFEYTENNISTPSEYQISFYGKSKNGKTGKNAEWALSSYHRFTLDTSTNLEHPALRFITKFSTKACEATNSWFFDMVMAAVYDLKPICSGYSTVELGAKYTKEQALNNYTSQVIANTPRKWNLEDIGNNRKFMTHDGIQLSSVVEVSQGKAQINFIHITVPTKNKKVNHEFVFNHVSAETGQRNVKQMSSWWKFW